MSCRAGTRHHEIGEFVAIKWLEPVERDGSRRSARRMRPEKPSGRVGKPRLARPLPPGLSPRGFYAGPRVGQCRAISNPNASRGRRRGSESTQAPSPIESDGA
jgi:hypothetical protein